MSEPTPSADEQATKDELLFSLHHRDKPTLAFVECKSTAKRDELAHCLQAELPEYQFYTLDVTPLPVASLVRTLSEHLPDHIKNSAPVTYVVNVYGLENRLDEQLAAQLNLERELLFRNVPYITVVWADGYFFRRLQRLAPDLWHWVTYKFRFDDPTVPAPEQQIPLPASRLPQKGDIEARRQRIQELEERYSHLDLDDSNKIRLLRDKINNLSLLADEYAEAFEYNKAINAYNVAIALEKQVQEAVTHQNRLKGDDGETKVDGFLLGKLLFNLGTVYSQVSLFEESLSSYSQSLVVQPESINGNTYHALGVVYAQCRRWDDALEAYEKAIIWKRSNGGAGTTYHQIGMVYELQKKWELALTNYNKALVHKKSEGDIFDLGSTYFHLGRVFALQKQYVLALDNYQKALDINRQVGNTYRISGVYFQIGRLYEDQMQLDVALHNYEQSLQWDEKTGNIYELGTVYHQIGVIYSTQEKWEFALINYEKAIALKQKTSNIFDIGGTYYNIGRVYDAQEKWILALSNYEQALEWTLKTENIAALGGIYFDTGRVYAKQCKWETALENYKQALKWDEQVGDIATLGLSYFHIGRAYEELAKLSEAYDWLVKAVLNLTTYSHPNLSIAESTLIRIKNRLAQSPAGEIL